MKSLFKYLRRAALLAASLALAPDARAADTITTRITLTNLPAGLSSNITYGTTRYWTNSPAASPSTLIQMTNTIPLATTNLLNQLSSYKAAAAHQFSQENETNIVIRQAGSATMPLVTIVGGWGYVVYSTNTQQDPTLTVHMPLTVEAPTNQTNIASLMVKGISDSSTNAIATNSIVGTNYLQTGAGPQQYIASPKQFNGVLRAAKEVALTNGFTSSITNINPWNSNLVNQGAAIRSEGPGGNSFQAGSNAIAAGDFDISIGNSTLTSNGYNSAVGTGVIATNGYGTAHGTGSRAGRYAVAMGANTASDGEAAITAGANSENYASNSILLAFETVQIAAGYGSVGLGGASWAMFGIALGLGSFNNYSNSAAIGPPDDAGTAVATTDTNQVRLGTSRHRISAPGLYESPKSTNAQFAGTNIIRGSVSYPAFSLTSIANGNNMAVPIGTNSFVILSGTVTAAPTIVGMVGSSTTGANDGHDLEIHNRLGYACSFANASDADPVAANRIVTLDGSTVTIPDNGWIRFKYETADSRWHVKGVYPATNLVAISTNSILSALIVGPSGGTITNILTATASLNFPAVGAQTETNLVITVTGAASGDVPTLGFTNDIVGGCFTCRASNNTVHVRLHNYSASPIDLPASTFKVIVTKF